MHNSTRVVVLTAALGSVSTYATAQTPAPTPTPAPITISPALPQDIFPNGVLASSATPTQSAQFAWQEFIALNWPAVKQTGTPGTRDTPDTNKKFGDPSYTGPLVWHTYRSKVEIFPGVGVPPGGTPATAPSACLPNNPVTVLAQLSTPTPTPTPYYGYDALPSYVYGIASANGSGPGTPWINLDENSQIGLDNIYAGVAAANKGTLGNQILFLAKANRKEFDYIAPNGWWTTNTSQPCANNTVKYLQANLSDPPAGTNDNLISFPNGTVELKAAWRKLAPTEDASRFYTTTTRHYVKHADGSYGHVDETLALIALHIIQKTPTAPYFIFATFEQADNITDANGKPVEDADGNIVANPAPATPLTPNVSSNNSTATSNQTFTPALSTVTDPGGQLYYINVPQQNLVEGKILVNKREHPITKAVVDVNREAHAAIANYAKANFKGAGANGAPWIYYKLINVQNQPLNKPTPGQTYAGADVSTYYQANSVVETDYNLQVFSGRFSGRGYGNTISDFLNGAPFTNVTYALPGANGMVYNMGGCMGCHGNMQQAGFDFSFILGGGRVSNPDAAGSTLGSDLAKIQKYLANHQ